MTKIARKSISAIAAWCLYDWACGSFTIIVITFIFSTYFTTRVAENHILGTYQWANATSLAGLLIALLSPLMGAVADYGGYHKRWLLFFTCVAVISSALLWFAYPSPSYVFYTLSVVVLGTVAYEIALVFYNAFLPGLVPGKYLGRVSAWGWGSGYLGGILCLTIALFAFIKGGSSWLDVNTAAQVRICGLFAALWYGVFAIPFFIFVPNLSSESRPFPEALRMGCKELFRTLKALPSRKNIFLYLIAHMIYTDGLNTLFAFGGIYAAGTFHLSFEEVLVFGITMNITAGIGAISLGWADDYFGSKPTILISLLCLTLLGIPLLLLHDKYVFWTVALLVCIFVGPIQSASRSLMVRLMITDGKVPAEMFGLYALSGRITAFLGPWLLGVATLKFNSQRVGMATMLIFFIVGALLLIPVKTDQHAQG